jgi:hypothetical protein
LSGIDFVFAGAEPCAIDGGKTVHLLYVRHHDLRDPLSLFVQTDAGQLPIAPDKAYALADATHPMLVWKTNGLVLTKSRLTT